MIFVNDYNLVVPSYVPDIIIPIAQKFSKNIDGHDPKSGISLDF